MSVLFKLRREERRLDRVELTGQLGVNRQTVSQWWQAKAVPRPRRIRKLAEAGSLGIVDLPD